MAQQLRAFIVHAERRPEFDSQQPRAGLQLSLTPVSGALTPFSDL